MVTRYPLRVGERSRLLLGIAFGVTRDTAWTEVGDGVVRVRFGWFEFTAPIARVVRWRIAGSPRGGARLDFRAPVRWRFLEVPAAYYGVDDLEGFAAQLTSLGIDGEDARTSST